MGGLLGEGGGANGMLLPSSQIIGGPGPPLHTPMHFAFFFNVVNSFKCKFFPVRTDTISKGVMCP